ncbi:hypothetical protein BKA93DRAFT_754317 [Sparassis latifolia]
MAWAHCGIQRSTLSASSTAHSNLPLRLLEKCTSIRRDNTNHVQVRTNKLPIETDGLSSSSSVFSFPEYRLNWSSWAAEASSPSMRLHPAGLLVELSAVRPLSPRGSMGIRANWFSPLELNRALRKLVLERVQAEKFRQLARAYGHFVCADSLYRIVGCALKLLGTSIKSRAFCFRTHESDPNLSMTIIDKRKPKMGMLSMTQMKSSWPMHLEHEKTHRMHALREQGQRESVSFQKPNFWCSAYAVGIISGRPRFSFTSVRFKRGGTLEPSHSSILPGMLSSQPAKAILRVWFSREKPTASDGDLRDSGSSYSPVDH